MMGGVLQNRKGGFKTEKGVSKLKRRFQNRKGGFKTQKGVSKLERRFQN